MYFIFVIIIMVMEMEYKITTKSEMETIELAQNFESEKIIPTIQPQSKSETSLQAVSFRRLSAPTKVCQIIFLPICR